MNKRQYKKYLRNEYPIDPIMHCVNRDCCSDACDGCSYPAKKWFCRALKREGLSLKGWKLIENPISGVFIFYNFIKEKEITLEYSGNNQYVITVFDFNSHQNIPMNSMRDALTNPLQNGILNEVLKAKRKSRKQSFRYVSV